MTCLSMNEVTIALAKTMSDIVKCNRISFVKYSAYLCGLAKMIKTAGDFPYPAVLVIYPEITRSTELCFFFVLSAKHNSAFNSLGVSVAPLSSFLFPVSLPSHQLAAAPASIVSFGGASLF